MSRIPFLFNLYVKLDMTLVDSLAIGVWLRGSDQTLERVYGQYIKCAHACVER